MRVVVTQRNGGQVTAEDLEQEQADHSGVVCGVGQRGAGWKAQPRSGLGAQQEGEHRG